MIVPVFRASATLAASFELMGRHERAVAEMARLTQAEPKLCLANLRTRFPIVRDEMFDLFSGALQRAGLPPGSVSRG
jgi:hypothetical protein